MSGSSRVTEEWEKAFRRCQLGSFVRVRQGYTFNPKYQGATKGKWAYAKVSDMEAFGSSKWLRFTRNRVSDDVLKEIKATPFPAGTVVFPRVGAALRTNKKRILPEPALVDDNLMTVVVTDTSACSSEFLYYWFESINIEQFANDGALPSINGKNLLSGWINLPPLEEQRKIADILSTWDEAIEQQTRLLELKRERKRGLMQQLLTGKVRFKEFEGLEWKLTSFENTFNTVNGKRYQIQKTSYADTGKFPIVDQGQSQIAGFTDSTNVFEDLPIIVFGDHTRIIKWVDFPFVVGADGTQLLKTVDGIDQNFGFYLLQTAKLPNLGYSRHMRELKERTFAVPTSLTEQQKIAAVLSTADAELETLQTQLAALRTQKRGLMQQLLTGKTRVNLA